MKRSSLQKPVPQQRNAADSSSILKTKAAHELFFAVVGPVGAGSSLVARQLQARLEGTKLGPDYFQCQILKAGDILREWAATTKGFKPGSVSGIDAKINMQGFGDELRQSRRDNAAVAVGLVGRIAAARAELQKKSYNSGDVVEPDGKPRAYILDSLKHPAEAHLLRRLYGDAFVLIAVVCSEPVRRVRLANAFFGGTERHRPSNKTKVTEFMRRDADDREHSYGQHVTDTFQEADFFIDNTLDIETPASGDMRDVADLRLLGEFDRLISVIMHKKILRPTTDETAMHLAFSAKLRSSCLSRQVGASLIDRHGNAIATGTNEVPKAGGGVYGEHEVGANVLENRCAFCDNGGEGPYCSNNKRQNDLIGEAIAALFQGQKLTADERDEMTKRLRKTQAGSLLEFSRSVHAEMDALLSAARSGTSVLGTRLFVTTFPCHYCARHIVSAGVTEVQYIEPYPKSLAVELHGDSIETIPERWVPVWSRQSEGERDAKSSRIKGIGAQGGAKLPTSIKVGELGPEVAKVLFKPFVGVAPKLYARVFLKDREYKDKVTGKFQMSEPEWGSPWSEHQVSYAKLEAELTTKASAAEQTNA